MIRRLLSLFRSSPAAPIQTVSSLCDAYQNYRTELSQLGEIRRSTLEFQNSVLKNFRMFTHSAFLCDRRPADFLGADLQSFYLWVIREKKATRAYSAKNVQVIKSMFSWAVEQGALPSNHLLPLRFKRGGRKRIHYLSQQHLDQLSSHRFFTQRLQQVADLFTLQCHTGFAYSDLADFDPGLHTQMMEGRRWICKPRHKTEVLCILPLFEPAERILAKYTRVDIHGRRMLELPLISNQKYNSYLKEIGQMLDLPYELTTHVGRKTFGTLALSKGYSMEAVSKMLGHTSIKTTQDHYAVILNQRIIAEGF